MKQCLGFMALAILLISGCTTSYVRLPSSANQVYSNNDVRQALSLLAQNGVVVHVPESTTREFEKTEIDSKCRRSEEPLWSSKLSIYLNEFRRRPELLSRIHVIEIKRGDTADVKIQKDLDDALTISIQFVKFENHGKVSFQTQLPCNASVAEYLGRSIVKTDYEFPDSQKFVSVLQSLPERKEVSRFQFSRDFLGYLASRGAILKFSHELSFEKTAQGEYVLVELLNRLADESKQPFHQHMNYWFQQIHKNSSQAQLIQLFAIINETELKAGVRVEDARDVSQVVNPQAPDVTYLYITYNVENDRVNAAELKDLDKCLQNFTDDMSGFKFRKPASQEKTSYLKPGYNCRIPLGT
ncbi:hypothetical protein [Pseudobdellovibrio exovorus]|uniref:Lipoprotein n=1 Tax=Pseudobdellovibrio exovorus JSS TaxID=1184267 RepID=M4VEE5_9BACT|nr:hypothetical protein [Pseudobdellovibrio exovorus]AGH96406.1 hypothetical protein A11Q_2190 [Pseudobdellovibrio exovorus JSS]